VISTFGNIITVAFNCRW